VDRMSAVAAQGTPELHSINGGSPATRDGARADVAAPAPVLYSDEVDQILSENPGWAVRWGMAVMLLVLTLGFIIAATVRFPEIVHAPVVLLTEELPVGVAARVTGRLARVLVREKEHVMANAPLALLESPAAYEDVLRLAHWLDSAQRVLAREEEPGLSSPPQGLRLGPLDEAEMAIRLRLSEYLSFRADPSYASRRALLQAQLEERERMAESLAEQRELALEMLTLAERDLERDRALFERGLLPEARLNEAVSRVLERRVAAAQAEAASLSVGDERLALRRTLVDLEAGHLEQERALKAALLSAIQAAHGQATEWQRQHVLRAPIAGLVTFVDLLQVGQVVTASEEILAVVPETSRVIGKMLLPESAAGRAKAGMTVRITLQSYPNQDFGSIEAVIADIALMPREGAYLAVLDLPHGLTTSLGKEITFQQQMVGIGEIMLDHRSLLQRFAGAWNEFRLRRLGKADAAAE